MEPPYTALAHAGPPGIDMWLVDLDAYNDGTRLTGLSADEHARALRMRVRSDALRYLGARHALRRLLGEALAMPPEDLPIAVSRDGKPRLDGEPALHFNVSHSGKLALIALSRTHEIGVDIEVERRVRDAEALAAAHFTPAEQAEWRAAGSPDALFLACWTRKEACVKALGLGLSGMLAVLETGCAPCRERRTVAVRGRARSVDLYSLEPARGAVGALCVL